MPPLEWIYGEWRPCYVCNVAAIHSFVCVRKQLRSEARFYKVSCQGTCPSERTHSAHWTYQFYKYSSSASIHSGKVNVDGQTNDFRMAFLRQIHILSQKTIAAGLRPATKIGSWHWQCKKCGLSFWQIALNIERWNWNDEWALSFSLNGSCHRLVGFDIIWLIIWYYAWRLARNDLYNLWTNWWGGSTQRIDEKMNKSRSLLLWDFNVQSDGSALIIACNRCSLQAARNISWNKYHNLFSEFESAKRMHRLFLRFISAFPL